MVKNELGKSTRIDSYGLCNLRESLALAYISRFAQTKRSSRCPTDNEGTSALTFVLEKIELVPNESLSSLKHSSMKEEKKEKRADESRRRRRRRHYFRNENVSNENLPKGARAKWWS